ncbi:MAG: efflux RND transporter periplasmic adaptor subunit [Deltaproteobacteria bacterium]|nr:efflux RND transporter periplasmic adaptor subunit [Deltaproteobacteria bacterium]
MDRAIEKKGWPPKKLIFVSCICAIIIFLAYLVISRSGTTRLTVDPTRMTISEVKYGEFREYYPFDGQVIPLTSVYLDVDQGGKVEELYVEGGKPIEKGDLILKFSNNSVQMDHIRTETALFENLDSQQNTQLLLAKDKLNRKETLLTYNYEIIKLEKQYNRYKVLKAEEIAISEEEYETVADQLEYKKAQRELLKERIKQEDIMADKQLEQAEKAIERINLSLDILSKQIESMVVRAPISGHLSSINAEIGQQINPGQRIGQIDILDKFKIRAGVDQYYNSKVTVGTKGKFTLDNKSYEVEVIKIYPEIINNLFTVDMAFSDEPPAGIKRGQTLTVELTFSEAEQRLMVTKGGFFQETGGRWVYIVSQDGATAQRVDIRLGRQNPRYVEVLEGLKEGDMVVTSGYDTFKEADTLIFKEPISLAQ